MHKPSIRRGNTLSWQADWLQATTRRGTWMSQLHDGPLHECLRHRVPSVLRTPIMTARAIRDAKLDTPAARAKLKVSGKPYYRGLVPEGHDGRELGTRFYLGDERYETARIDAADDVQPADGSEILTSFQAQEKTRVLAAS